MKDMAAKGRPKACVRRNCVGFIEKNICGHCGHPPEKKEYREEESFLEDELSENVVEAARNCRNSNWSPHNDPIGRKV